MAFLSLGPMLPTVEISVDFANDPTSASRDWTDITPYVREFATRRGRPDALSRINTGTLALLLQNQDGRFDPTYAGSLVNLCTNPSLETDTATWARYAGAETFTRDNTTAQYGTYSAKVVTTAGSGNEGLQVSVSVVSGLAYTVSAWMRGTGTVVINWLASNSAPIVLTTTWTRYSFTQTAASSGSSNAAFITNSAQAVTFWVDGVQVEEALAATAYVDGSQDNCRWTGTAHASTSYRGGPYYPNVLPMRRIRVLAQWAGVTYNVFHGYIEDWPLSFPDLNRNALVHVRAVDALAILPTFDLGGQSYASQLSSVRGSAVLTTIGFGTADMSISTGQSTLIASGTITAGSDALAHLLDVQASENGLLFADTGGTLVYQDRHFRAKNRTSSSGTIGTGGGLIGYRDIRTSYGISDLWNAITVTANGGTAETAVDASSTASYYRRALTWPVGGSYLVASQAEALNAAQHVRALYSQPALRVPEVAVVGAGGTANWATILAFEISSRATIAHVTPAGGTITGDKYVEGIGHSVTFERDWETTLPLSDAPSQAVWILGDANLSKIGETTVLGY